MVCKNAAECYLKYCFVWHITVDDVKKKISCWRSCWNRQSPSCVNMAWSQMLVPAEEVWKLISTRFLCGLPCSISYWQLLLRLESLSLLLHCSLNEIMLITSLWTRGGGTSILLCTLALTWRDVTWFWQEQLGFKITEISDAALSSQPATQASLKGSRDPF